MRLRLPLCDSSLGGGCHGAIAASAGQCLYGSQTCRESGLEGGWSTLPNLVDASQGAIHANVSLALDEVVFLGPIPDTD